MNDLNIRLENGGGQLSNVNNITVGFYGKEVNLRVRFCVNEG